MYGVKVDDRLAPERAADQDLPSVVAEKPFKKVIAQRRVAQTALVFNRHKRKAFREGSGKETCPAAARHALSIVKFHPLDPAARRIFFENVSREIRVLECLDIVRKGGGVPVAVGMLVDRSAGTMRFDVPAISLLELSFPTYEADKLPPELAALPVEKPGS